MKQKTYNQSWFVEKINKNDRSLARPIRKKVRENELLIQELNNSYHDRSY